ncbi:MAG: hypothetical protein ACM3UZ_14145 [Acidobacteriota bacterium]
MKKLIIIILITAFILTSGCAKPGGVSSKHVSNPNKSKLSATVTDTVENPYFFKPNISQSIFTFENDMVQ